MYGERNETNEAHSFVLFLIGGQMPLKMNPTNKTQVGYGANRIDFSGTRTKQKKVSLI